MTTETMTPHRTPLTPERDSFWRLVHAEWTKFRTVRGWVIAAGITIVAIAAFVFLASDVSSTCGGDAGGRGRLPGASRPGLAVCRSRTCSTSRTSR